MWLTLFYLSNLSWSSFFFASSALRLASNSSLRLSIILFIALVLEGFSTCLSVTEVPYLASDFNIAALNLSTGADYYYSFKYYLSNVFKLVFVKLGLFGLVTYIYDFFLLSFWLNLC